ncbi:MAG: type VI secretion system protein TssA [Pseudomonadota bacterium]
MAQLDSLLTPIPGENPSGIELRHDPDFQRLSDSLKPQVEVARDNLNNPVSSSEIPTDWTSILADAKELAQRGRDLRLLVIIAQAEFQTGGFAGLNAALDVLSSSIKQFWDTIHPGLRGPAENPDSALGRKNALLQLENENDGLIGDIMNATLFSVRGGGDVTGQDLAAASMTVADVLAASAQGLGEKEKAKAQSDHEDLVIRINGAARGLAKQDAKEFAAIRDDLDAAAVAVKNLETIVTDVLSDKAPFRLPKLAKALTRMQATLGQAAGAADAEVQSESKDAPTEQDVKAPPEDTASAPLTPASKLNGGTMPEHLKSREDVARVLGLVVDFYERTEPSSPIPHLARRLQKMVPMNFVELMEEIAPGGLKDFKNVAGIGSDKS